MKQYIALIRGGTTKSGRDGKYMGVLNEPLLQSERKNIRQRAVEHLYPKAEIVYTSPMQQCVETARLIYPRIPAIVEQRLIALDVGYYTGWLYTDIVVDRNFAGWAENRQLLPLGGGEKPYEFIARCVRAFQKIVEELESKGIQDVAIITHELVINAILSRYCLPRNPYKNWSIARGKGYYLHYESSLKIGKVGAIF